MSLSVVQHVLRTGAGTNFNPSWPGATTAGSLLVAVVTTTKSTGSGTCHVTAAAGSFASASGGTSYGGITSGDPTIQIFHLDNAASQSSTGNWTGSSASTSWAIELIEIAGAATSTPLDQSTGNSSGTTTNSFSTGTTGATGQASEIVIAGFAAALASQTYSSPTSGYSILDQGNDNASEATVAAYYNILSSTGTQACAVSYSSSQDYGAAIATFKASGGGGGSVSNGSTLAMMGVGHHEDREPVLSRRGRRNRRHAWEMLRKVG